MEIKPVSIDDSGVSGLKLTLVEGTHLNRIHIEITGTPIVNNRDFYFTKEGELDGTGSAICDDEEPRAQ